MLRLDLTVTLNRDIVRQCNELLARRRGRRLNPKTIHVKLNMQKLPVARVHNVGVICSAMSAGAAAVMAAQKQERS